MALKAVLSVLIICLSSMAIAAGKRPFNISVYGNFKQILYTGDAPGKISLASIPHLAGTYGVGALADMGQSVSCQ